MFPYALALELGLPLADIENMTHAEYVRWRAFMVWRQVQRDHAAAVAKQRAARR